MRKLASAFIALTFSFFAGGDFSTSNQAHAFIVDLDAMKGGAIYVGVNTKIDIGLTYISHNHASNGGFLYSSSSTVVFNSPVYFERNHTMHAPVSGQSYSYGGAIYMRSTTVTFNDKATFYKNNTTSNSITASFICLWRSNIRVIIQYVDNRKAVFEENHSEANSDYGSWSGNAYGGAIFATGRIEMKGGAIFS